MIYHHAPPEHQRGAQIIFQQKSASDLIPTFPSSPVEFNVQGGVIPLNVQRAIEYQINDQVRPQWGNSPVAFSQSAPNSVVLESLTQVDADCGNWFVNACHESIAGHITIYTINLTSVISHELTESVVNPSVDTELNGQFEEICDPVASYEYLINGVAVSDFVYKSWFTGGARPLDQLSFLRHAGDGAPISVRTYREARSRIPWSFVGSSTSSIRLN